MACMRALYINLVSDDQRQTERQEWFCRGSVYCGSTGRGRLEEQNDWDMPSFLDMTIEVS